MKILIVLSLVVASTLSAAVHKSFPLQNWLADEGVAAYNRHTRIVNGQVVVANDIPFQVAVLTSFPRGTSLCGGSLLTRDKVLTAAHCWWDGTDQGFSIEVVLGALRFNANENSQQRQVTTRIVLHPQYDRITTAQDIAVITLNSLVTLTNSIQTIPLPTGSLVNQNFEGETATISGWGRTGDGQGLSPDLRSVEVPVLAQAACRGFFPVHALDSNICTSGEGPRGVCSSDSGGPVTVVRGGTRVLVGVVSFGSGFGCSRGYPSVHARITSFLEFIQQNL